MSGMPIQPQAEAPVEDGAGQTGASTGFGSARPVRRRRWFPTLIVLVVMFVTVFGGYVAAAALSEPAGRPVSIEGIARVQPLSGWEFAGRFAAGGARGIRLTRGSGNLDVVVTPAGSSPDGLARTYVDDVLRPEAQPGSFSIQRGLERVRLANGLDAVRFSYIGVFERNGTPIEGEVTVAVSSSGTGVVFDAWAPQGLLQFVRGDVETMESAAVLA